MAESANLRQNLQNVPSIFEINAAETLDTLIYPALGKVFDFFGLRINWTLGRWRIHEEFSPLVTWAIQYLYLRKRGASFGESFYGLQRTDSTTCELLTRRQQFLSATLLTFVPYLERKLKDRSARHESTSKWEEYLLKAIYAYNASKSVHIYLYLIKYAVSHAPIFRALGLTLRYPEDPPNEDKTTYVFLKLLEVFAFFLQFIQWWYSSDQRRKMANKLRNPEAMILDEKQQKQNCLPKGDCPVCLMHVETPTAVSVSGYVFCWKCIMAHLKQHPTCPVTGYGISIDDLVRIYE